MNKGLTVYDPKFQNAVTTHVADVEKQVALLDDPKVVAQELTKNKILEQMAKDLKADSRVINQLKYAKMLAAGRLGQLMPRQQGKRDVQLPAALQEVSSNTISAYRKLGDHFDQIEPYYAAICEASEMDPESGERLSVAGFLRSVKESVQPTKVRNYAGNSEWYTPSEYIEAARATMGGIDCDPASCAKAQKTVKADTYFNAKTNGLKQSWEGRVWLNPPYNRGLISEFVSKFIEELDAGHIKQAIVLTNNNTDTRWWHELATYCRKDLLYFRQDRF